MISCWRVTDSCSG